MHTLRAVAAKFKVFTYCLGFSSWIRVVVRGGGREDAETMPGGCVSSDT